MASNVYQDIECILKSTHVADLQVRLPDAVTKLPVGSILEAARLRKKWTLQTLAEKAKMRPDIIHRFET